jgi:hypothetical protein
MRDERTCGICLSAFASEKPLSREIVAATTTSMGFLI